MDPRDFDDKTAEPSSTTLVAAERAVASQRRQRQYDVPRPEPARLPLPRLRTPREVGEWLNISEKAVYTRAERGALPGVIRRGRRIYFLESALLNHRAGSSNKITQPPGVQPEYR